jgi:hypothetical protein
MTVVPYNKAKIGETDIQVVVTPENWPAPIGEDAKIGLAWDFVGTVAPHSEADPSALSSNSWSPSATPAAAAPTSWPNPTAMAPTSTL